MTNLAISKTGNRKRVRLQFRASRDIPIYLLLLPGFLLVLVFCYFPMYGVIIAFENYSPYKGIFGSPFVGFEHFLFFLTDEGFWEVFRNTVIISLYYLIFSFPAPIIFALSLNEIHVSMLKRITQTISYLPYFVSWVVVSSLAINILSPESGLVNLFLNQVFGMEPQYFLGESRFFRGVLTVTAVWKDIGINSVYYLATLSTVDPQLYEAAEIDGANLFQKIRFISVPSLRYIATILFLLQIGNVLNVNFEQVFLLSTPLVYDVGDVISTYTYRLGIAQAQFSKTTAIGLTQSVINFALVYTANAASRKWAGWSMW